ncbi:MAG: glycosyltransferase [Chloroflexota bacterium]
MKVALVHDYLFEQGGAENVFQVFLDMFPDAPIFTSIYAPDTVAGAFRARQMHTSFLQRLTTDKRKAKALLPLYPAAFHRMKLRGYDLVLSSASSFAKGIAVGSTPHVCYCHTPPRFLWQADRYGEGQRHPVARAATRIATGLLRHQDRHDAANVDRFIANSRVTQRRIARIYGRQATVIHPPIAVDDFAVAGAVTTRFLVVSRLLPYKRVDIVIAACNRLGLPLDVVGDGPDRHRLQAMAGPTVTLHGRLPRPEVAWHLGRARALILPGEEDFGLTPLEANASGRPVLAYRAGGALETVVDGQTGWFFERQTVDSVMAALQRIGPAADRIEPKALRAHARRFDVAAFRASIQQVLQRALTGR